MSKRNYDEYNYYNKPYVAPPPKKREIEFLNYDVKIDS